MDLYLGQMKDVVLGQDFLTWLWYKSDVTGGRFEDKGEVFELHMEQRVSVQGGEGDTLETATVSGAMSELREARLGLRTGKKVNRAQIRIEKDVEAWSFTLKAEDFSIGSLRTPTVETKLEEGDDPDAPFLEKMFLLEKCLSHLDAVYAAFLNVRFGTAWDEEVQAFRTWLTKAE